MVYDFGRRPHSNSIRPRTTWKSISPRGSDRTVVGNQNLPPCAFQFSRQRRAVMSYRIFPTPDYTSLLNGNYGLAAAHALRLRRPCRQDNICLDSPFHRTETLPAPKELSQPEKAQSIWALSRPGGRWRQGPYLRQSAASCFLVRCIEQNDNNRQSCNILAAGGLNVQPEPSQHRHQLVLLFILCVDGVCTSLYSCCNGRRHRSVRFATSPGPQVESESCSYREGCTDSREQTLRFPPHRDRAGCCTATVLERALVLQP